MSETCLPLASALAALPLFLGVALATFLLMRRLSRRRRADRKAEGIVNGSKAPAVRRSSQSHEPAELLRFQVEMQELHRELSARLDTKMSALMQLIRQADERIAELEERSDQARNEHAPPSDVAANEELSKPPADVATVAIQELATQGLSAATIAHRLSKSVAEVESVLALYVRTPHSPGADSSR